MLKIFNYKKYCQMHSKYNIIIKWIKRLIMFNVKLEDSNDEVLCHCNQKHPPPAQNYSPGY